MAEAYAYNADGTLHTMRTATGGVLTMGYDGLLRLNTITGGIYTKTYTYRDISGTQTTGQISAVTYDLPTDQVFAYTYDSMGNILTYTAPDGEVITYTYDSQGQLLSAQGEETYTYTYDSVGNILTANGHTYTYGNADWRDLLTAYDGENITYDANGNPTSYYNGTRWTLTWENGRQLVTATDGTRQISYTYDADGLRTGMTVTNTAALNGLYTDADGEIRYYVDGEATYAGLVYCNGYYYYINSSKTAVKDTNYWPTYTNGLMEVTPANTYYFDEYGRLKQGLYVDDDGETRYYEMGVPSYAGLVYWNGYYYYINSSKTAVKDQDYWITNNNGLMESALYHFDEQGRMTNPPDGVMTMSVDEGAQEYVAPASATAITTTEEHQYYLLAVNFCGKKSLPPPEPAPIPIPSISSTTSRAGRTPLCMVVYIITTSPTCRAT